VRTSAAAGEIAAWITEYSAFDPAPFHVWRCRRGGRIVPLLFARTAHESRHECLRHALLGRNPHVVASDPVHDDCECRNTRRDGVRDLNIHLIQTQIPRRQAAIGHSGGYRPD
jgi:hypothetical protein